MSRPRLSLTARGSANESAPSPGTVVVRVSSLVAAARQSVSFPFVLCQGLNALRARAPDGAQKLDLCVCAPHDTRSGKPLAVTQEADEERKLEKNARGAAGRINTTLFLVFGYSEVWRSLPDHLLPSLGQVCLEAGPTTISTFGRPPLLTGRVAGFEQCKTGADQGLCAQKAGLVGKSSRDSGYPAHDTRRVAVRTTIKLDTWFGGRLRNSAGGCAERQSAQECR